MTTLKQIDKFIMFDYFLMINNNIFCNIKHIYIPAMSDLHIYHIFKSIITDSFSVKLFFFFSYLEVVIVVTLIDVQCSNYLFSFFNIFTLYIFSTFFFFLTVLYFLLFIFFYLN